MTVSEIWRWGTRLMGAAVVGASVSSAQAASRPLTVEDVIALQYIGQVAISPDGQWVAVVVKRSGGPVMITARTDVWLLPIQGGAARNLTRRAGTDATRWWNPTWSPDGARLAMLSSTRDSSVTAYIWTAHSGRLAALDESSIDVSVSTDEGYLSPLSWLDSATLLLPELPRGALPGFRHGSNSWIQRIAPIEWAKTDAGVEPAVSVLESGAPTTQEPPHDELRAVNVVTHANRKIADGYVRQIMISPNKRYAALIVDVGWNPLPLTHQVAAYEPHTTDGRHTRLLLARLDTAAPPQRIEGVRDPDIPTIVVRHAWSPDGNTFGVVAKDDSTAPYPATAFLVSVRDNTVEMVTDRTFAVSRVRWTGSNRAFALGKRTIFASAHADTTREVWLPISTQAAGDTVTQPPRPDTVVPEWVNKLHKPSAGATIAAIDSSHELIVFTSAERTGSYLWVANGRTAVVERRLALNEQLTHIADAQRTLIHYVGIDGDSLTGILVLPVGYVATRRYALITWVYGGWCPADTLDEELDKQSISGLNLALIPAHGYALLIPSMPLKTSGMGSDPMLDVAKGVMSAVDEVVRRGVADPARLGLMGHSYGGYNTYSLVTYTNRFKAAVALAGISDLASFYGVFDPRTRYTELGYQDEWPVGWSESGFGGLGTAPWENLWRYLRNSPYYFAERVETPLMIVQGDVDAVSMEQGEEFFTALSRMNKPAKFVRYWGEPHVVERSPANVRDMWAKIFDWFDTRLRSDPQRTAIR